MRVLLDTHTFLWFVDGNPLLSPTARSILEDPGNERLVSLASAWEIAIKTSFGKLSLAVPVVAYVRDQASINGFDLLPISLASIGVVATLPFHHRDPFDRMLIAQCQAEGASLVSADTMLDSYGVPRLW